MSEADIKQALTSWKKKVRFMEDVEVLALLSVCGCGISSAQSQKGGNLRFGMPHFVQYSVVMNKQLEKHCIVDAGVGSVAGKRDGNQVRR